MAMRWTVGRRIGVVAAAVTIVTAAVGVIGFVQTSATGEDGREALAATALLAEVNDAQHTASVVLASAFTLLTPLDAAARQQVVDRATEHAGELRAQLDRIAAQRGRFDNGTEVDALAVSGRQIIDVGDGLAAAGGVVTAAQAATAQQVWDAFDRDSDALKGTLTDAAAARQRVAADGESRARLLIALVGGLTLPIVLAAMWLLARSVLRPVRQTRAVLEHVAAGDFTQRLPAGGSDELADMARALNTTVEQVGAALTAIATESGAVSTASSNLRDVSRHLTQGADRLAAESTAVATSIGETSHEVRVAADGTDQLQAAVGDIAAHVAQAARIAAEGVQVAAAANRTIGELGASSARIGEVAAVITAIADQTNLLALNATIEAARAGEMGKGFAVVASEVKDLAQETAKATSDIGERIGAIQADTASAVGELQRVTDTIDRIAAIQDTIAGSVQVQADAARDIGANVARAAAQAATVAERITGVSDTSVQTTASAQQTQTAAQRLSDTAERLHAVVARFRITAS
jgi:methyl-accepting chemotaxis protein